MHSLLTQNTWQGAELLPLLRDQLLADADETRVSLSGPAAMLDPQSALHLALVVHELATNARKYGAHSTGDGHVNVQWSVQSGPSQTLILNWRETGGPPVTAPAKRGFGTTLIEQSLRARGGEANLSYEADGVVCEIKLPLPEARPNALTALLGQQPEPARWSKPSADVAVSALQGKRIVVVEDEPLIAMDLVRA
jgi:two-component sensor histidine kinase